MIKMTTLTTEEERLVEIFKALSNPIRYRMIQYMVEHPMCITGELVTFVDLAQSTVSQHLKVLRECGLVDGEIEGPATCYCLNITTLRWFQTKVTDVTNQFAERCC